MSRGIFLQDLRGFAKLSCLFIPNVGLHFDLLHNVLEASPFFRNHRYKLKAELPPSAPPNDCLLNPNGWFVLHRQDADIQRGSRLNGGGTFDAAAPDGKIDEAPLSTDHADGGKRTMKSDMKPEVCPLFHRGAS
jgi:hypothetical protein